jgi:hypothetical protein
MVSPPRVPRNAQSGRKESGGPPRTKGVKIQAWKGGGSGPTMKSRPTYRLEGRRDGLSGRAPPTNGHQSPRKYTPETAKRRPRREMCDGNGAATEKTRDGSVL